MTAKPPIRFTDEVRREIQLRAYLIWENEGRPHGREKEHWRRAEAEILTAMHLVKAKPTVKTAAPKTAAPKAEIKPKAAAKPKAKKAAKPKSSH
jgi:hypothetical protein